MNRDAHHRILVVEDDHAFALLLEDMFLDRKLNCEMVRADRLSKALDLIGSGGQVFDLILLDLGLPDSSGIETFQKVYGALSLARSTPAVLVLTGLDDPALGLQAVKLGAQDYVVKGMNDWAPLIRSVQFAIERVQATKQIEELRKFEAIGRLAGGIAHDFNNALGVILGWSEVGLETHSLNGGVKEIFEKISRQAKHAAGLTAQLLAFARRQVLRPKPLLLSKLVSDASRLLGSAIGEQIDFRTVCGERLAYVCADQTQIEQVLINLCLNARDAMPNGGRISVETRNIELGTDFCRQHSFGSPGKYVQLSVSDTGQGMDEGTQARIFEPFFTTKEAGKGTGLGLATVFGIVTQHDGLITVSSQVGQGTTFCIYLPAVPAETNVVGATDGKGSFGGTETILVAEDHDGLREIDVETLSGVGYRVLTATDGEEAVKIFKSRMSEIKLVVLDVAMPRMTGPVAFTKLRALDPDIPVIFKTGYTEELASLDSSIRSAAGFLQKPYSAKDFCKALRSALDRVPASR